MPVAAVLKNAHITDILGRLTVAGLMFFAKEPQLFRPQFCIKAVWFAGNHIGGTKYHDSRDITGTIPEMYEDAIRWLKSCLNRPQNGQSFNSEGILEIPEIVLEELMQNALVHLDLLKPAAIRLLVFDNRIEIVNPGCLPDGQTIEEVMMGNSDPRNPQLAQFGSKTMPYRGLGSGIPRVMAENCDVELIDRPDGNQFIARIWRTTQNAILDYLKEHSTATRQEVAAAIGNITEDGVKYNIGKLQQYGRLKRENGRKNGSWLVVL